MGSFCTSKPQVQTSNTTQSFTADPRVAAAGEQTLNMATGAASQPFQMPAAPVAGFNPFQQQSFNQVQGLQGGLQPYFDRAGAQMTEAGSPVTQAETQSYMNPFADEALANMKKYVFDPQRTQTMGRATQMAGGVGADRLALTSQNLDKTQADAIGGAQAGFYGQAMQQAQRAKEMALQSAGGWANLGTGFQTGQLQGTAALAGAGAQQQQQSQREMMSPYEQRLAELAYPMQQASFLSGITGNMSNVFKGTTTGQGTTTTQPSQPSLFNQIAGLGMAGLGMAGGFGGIGSMFGGGTSMPNSPSASMYYGNPMYAGFGPTYEAGGAVNPWDMGEGFEFGGDVEEYSPDQFNRMDAAAPPPEMASAEGSPNLSGIPRAYEDMLREEGLRREAMTRGAAGANSFAATQSPFQPQPEPTLPVRPPTPRPTPWDATPVSEVPGMSRSPMRAGPSRVSPYQPPESGGGINSDMKISDFSMPKGEQPYPDATARDWGQKLTRSPWMGLVHAGLKMAQSTKSGAAGLAEGLEAGAGHLDTQRKELRSEQQINQKAEELYRHAKSELDKYTRKTPHQLATEQESTRYHNILEGLGKDKISARMQEGSLVYAGPVKDQPGMGYFYDRKRLDANGQPSVFVAPFDPGEKPGTAGKSSRVTAHELYKKLYPEDPQGAQDILRGHKTMTSDDVRKRIEALVTKAMQAQPIQPGTQEWLDEHKRRSDELMAKAKAEYGLQ